MSEHGTHRLIDDLVADNQVGRRLASPLQRAVTWFAVALLTGGVIVWVTGAHGSLWPTLVSWQPCMRWLPASRPGQLPFSLHSS